MSVSPIIVRDLSVIFRSGSVLAGIDVTVAPGHRVALVGENGAGKSTLLRAIAGRLPASARVGGLIEKPADLVWLPQEPPFRDDHTVSDVLGQMLRPLRAAVLEVERLSEQLDDPQSAQRYAEVLDWAMAHEAWDADRRALMTAEQLGLGGIDQQRTIGSLSGGQRTRLALATAITRKPDALLLDEPTNHLDDSAVEVLVAFLRDLQGAILLASHDRVFLDEVATTLVDLDPLAGTGGTDGLGGRTFGGGWTAYEEAREAARARWEATYAAQQDELKRLRSAAQVGREVVAHGRGPTDNDKFIHAFKGQNVDRALARRKRDAVQRLEIAEEAQVRKPPVRLQFRADLTVVGAAGAAVSVRGLEVAQRLRVESVDVAAGEHLLITGSNGSGKSTLLGVLAGRIRPTRGEVQIGARVVAELAQDPQFADMSRSPAQIYDGTPAIHDVPLVELGLIAPRDLHRPVGALSVGQRRRLCLALAVGARPDLLLLDEPTNHISLALAGELEEALSGTAGAVIVASHDRWLRRRWQGSAIELHAVPDQRPQADKLAAIPNIL